MLKTLSNHLFNDHTISRHMDVPSFISWFSLNMWIVSNFSILDDSVTGIFVNRAFIFQVISLRQILEVKLQSQKLWLSQSYCYIQPSYFPKSLYQIVVAVPVFWYLFGRKKFLLRDWQCECVCMCMNICVCMGACMCAYMHVCTWMHVYVHVCVCVYWGLEGSSYHIFDIFV